ncbi:MAG: UDP-2,3-diacylglucosamine diphosphatase [Pseudomonadota bacterium]
MKEESLFISDLHLSLKKTETTQRFLRFLGNRAAGAERLFILGDLFDAWIGDDDPTPPNGKIKAGLKKLVASGTAVYLQLGNRDFLIGQRFSRETGVELLGDYVVIDLYGTPTLLMHGDLLCTDDLPYQAFRAKSRTPEWQHAVLAKPLPIRLLLARWYRLRSHWHKRKKTQTIMDVNQDCVVKTMIRHRATRLIHGHTHRPAVHELTLNGTPAQRFVLAEWRKTASVLCWNRSGYRIEDIH